MHWYIHTWNDTIFIAANNAVLIHMVVLLFPLSPANIERTGLTPCRL
jgi:hypothetical protein